MHGQQNVKKKNIYCFGSNSLFCHIKQALNQNAFIFTSNVANKWLASLLRINLLTPNDDYSGRTAPLTSKYCILYIYSTNVGTE